METRRAEADEEKPDELLPVLLTNKKTDLDENDTKDGWNWKEIIWRVINFIMAMFFALAAYVQLNDPDPVLWMFVYAVPGTLCLAIVVSVHAQEYVVWHSLTVANVVSSLAGSIYLATRIKPEMEKGSITNPLVLEEGREMSGLLISMLWSSICKIVHWCGQRKGKVSLVGWVFIVMICLVPFTLWAYCYRTLEPSALPGHCKDML